MSSATRLLLSQRVSCVEAQTRAAERYVGELRATLDGLVTDVAHVRAADSSISELRATFDRISVDIPHITWTHFDQVEADIKDTKGGVDQTRTPPPAARFDIATDDSEGDLSRDYVVNVGGASEEDSRDGDALDGDPGRLVGYCSRAKLCRMRAASWHQVFFRASACSPCSHGQHTHTAWRARNTVHRCARAVCPRHEGRGTRPLELDTRSRRIGAASSRQASMQDLERALAREAWHWSTVRLGSSHDAASIATPI